MLARLRATPTIYPHALNHRKENNPPPNTPLPMRDATRNCSRRNGGDREVVVGASLLLSLRASQSPKVLSVSESILEEAGG